MNSSYEKSSKPMSLNNFTFDLGLGSNRPRSLNDEKTPQTSSYTSSSFEFSQSRPSTTPSWQPRPSWSHQPAARPGVATSTAPTSMVGDILGKNWGSTSNAPASSIGIVNKNPNLFGDLVSSALGQNKGDISIPLKNATPGSGPVPNKDVYSVGNMADSLRRTGNSDWGSSESFGSYTSASASKNSKNDNVNTVRCANLGGQSIRNSGSGMGTNKDPFVSLVDFGSKPAGGISSSVGKANNKPSPRVDGFGNFQKASKPSTPAFMTDPFPDIKDSSMGLNSGHYPNLDNFAIPKSQNQPPIQSSGVDAFDTLFTSSAASAGGAPKGSDERLVSEQFSGAGDWGFDSNDTGGTTELEGLPPPPAGVSASTAKVKGMDNYKQGQYADAIKWLSWAVVLLENAGDDDATKEVLSSRASCYKEVGEYKKAVADCTKVLANDGGDVAVLVQRALLYESMEKYRLGAEDLRTVMKLDPGNRVAKSTIHRLKKMSE